MTAREARALHRRRVDELLREIDAQRRRRLLLEAAGAQAPGLERAARRQLAELLHGSGSSRWSSRYTEPNGSA